MKLKKWEMALIAALLAAVLAGASLEHTAEALSGKLVRLHVVANSDSTEDQALKLEVRDAVLRELEDRLAHVHDRETAERVIEAALPELVRAAETALAAEGAAYPVRASLCVESFPTTEYDTFALPAGRYTSLRVEVGEARGHNWWCVVFPPVCAAASLDSGTAAAIGLTEDEAALIRRDEPGVVVRFRLLELLAALKGLVAGCSPNS